MELRRDGDVYIILIDCACLQTTYNGIKKGNGVEIILIERAC